MIGIILGSDSDMPKVKDCFATLEDFGVPFEVIISSAHRTPDKTLAWAASARERGVKTIIAVAGGAAHLAGVVAAHTTLPVIAVPVETAISGGMDSVLSVLQMPAGVPVAAMAVGKSGGKNAALFALEILAAFDAGVADKLAAYRKKEQSKIQDKNNALAAAGWKQYVENIEAGK